MSSSEDNMIGSKNKWTFKKLISKFSLLITKPCKGNSKKKYKMSNNIKVLTTDLMNNKQIRLSQFCDG
jgi:hypothetical protein